MEKHVFEHLYTDGQHWVVCHDGESKLRRFLKRHKLPARRAIFQRLIKNQIMCRFLGDVRYVFDRVAHGMRLTTWRDVFYRAYPKGKYECPPQPHKKPKRRKGASAHDRKMGFEEPAQPKHENVLGPDARENYADWWVDFPRRRRQGDPAKTGGRS